MRKYRRNYRDNRSNNHRDRPYREHQQWEDPTSTRGPLGIMEEPMSRNEQISRWLSPGSPVIPIPSEFRPRATTRTSTDSFPWTQDYVHEDGQNHQAAYQRPGSGQNFPINPYTPRTSPPTYPQMIQDNAKMNRDKLLAEEYRYAGAQQEYQPPTCGPNTDEPIYRTATPRHQEIGFDVMTIPPAPWEDPRLFIAAVERQEGLDRERQSQAFKFDPEAPAFVPKQEEKREPPKKKEPVWFVVGK